MPTANTKVLSARIDKGKYYMLLERASARKMALSAYINVLFDELLALKQEVVQKAEKGVAIENPKPTNFKYWKEEEVLEFVLELPKDYEIDGVVTTGWSGQFAIKTNWHSHNFKEPFYLLEAFASGNSLHPILYKAVDIAEERERAGHRDTKIVFPKYGIEYVNGVGWRWQTKDKRGGIVFCGIHLKPPIKRMR